MLPLRSVLAFPLLVTASAAFAAALPAAPAQSIARKKELLLAEAAAS
jgi:hypothetical protein